MSNSTTTNKHSNYAEVRCCCNVSLLGYLPHTSNEHFAYFASDDGEVFEFQFTNYYLCGGLIRGMAFKSQDYPIEKLRTIEGWLEPDEVEAVND